jgi:hypothetical protein
LTFDHFISSIQKQICAELWSWVTPLFDVGFTYFVEVRNIGFTL